MILRRTVRAFSLVEVIIAVGIFSVAIATVLALLPATTKQAASSRDTQTAARLPDAVKLELQRLVPFAGYAAFAGRNLVAARDGTNVRAEPAANDNVEQYFLVEAKPFPAGTPLAYNAANPILPLTVTVSWPYRPQGPPGAFLPPTAAPDREQFTFNLALRP